MVLSYFFFASLNIFLQHATPSYYWDSSLSEITSLFDFLSILTSTVNPGICVFKKSFFFHYTYETFISFFCDFLV